MHQYRGSHSTPEPERVPFLATKNMGLLILLAAAFWAYWLSESVRYGDAPYYAEQLAASVIIEPGHLIWRPLGALLYLTVSRIGYTVDALWVIQGVCLVASLACVLAVYVFLSKWCSYGAALWGTGLFSISNGFWYYAFSGSSYSLSLFFIIIAFIFAISAQACRPHAVRSGFLSGVFGGLAAASWLVQGLNLPSLVLANVLFLGGTPRPLPINVVKTIVTFLAGYALTLGLPLIGTYVGVHVLPPKLYYYAPDPESSGLLHWVMSGSHGIRSTLGAAQGMRLVLGWAQSVLSAGDIGTHVRLWLLEDRNSMTFLLHPGIGSLVTFYAAVLAALLLLWRRKAALSADQRKIFAVGACSILANITFASCWQASDLERYLPSVLFLILGLCIAIDDRFCLRRTSVMVVGLLTIGTIAGINWFGTFYPSLAIDSYKQQWLAQIRLHMNGNDLLIVFGNKKYELVDPHNVKMPRILNISTLISMGKTEWRLLAQLRIAEACRQDGRVMIGDSVLGLDPRPRDGWSFKEYPTPSPKDLDSFFGPMKGELVFSASGERVWQLKLQHCSPN
jgi:hypothetical protein